MSANNKAQDKTNMDNK